MEWVTGGFVPSGNNVHHWGTDFSAYGCINTKKKPKIPIICSLIKHLIGRYNQTRCDKEQFQNHDTKVGRSV
ncbi:hypothetical protein T10_10307 [Trichinella papuae]|uniref:Uncharacterized protein n=1 Tax=Trichinella papuae TaxID=268474 RepID=A0A0V1MJ29_9BILA|nr:hypothetical protein T10_10307 [Trichinella papuae]